MIVAADRKQAQTVFGYVRGLLTSVPVLAQMVESEIKESISLTNGIRIAVVTASHRTSRGFTVVGAVLDELGFWKTDDAEIVSSIRHAMLTVPDALLLVISSPFAQSGELWRAHQAHWGKDGDSVLVWQAATQDMNPCVDDREIRRAYAEDRIAAQSDYGARFRPTSEAHIFTKEALSAVIESGITQREPQSQHRYVAFVDAAGGSGHDSFAVATSHAERDSEGRIISVLDCIREYRPPFSPEEVIKKIAGVLKLYHVTTVTGDAFAGAFAVEAFSKCGIRLMISKEHKSEIYGLALTLLNSKRIKLLDNAQLHAQLLNLVRRQSSGKSRIDHSKYPGARDDAANAACGSLLLAARRNPDVGDVGITFSGRPVTSNVCVYCGGTGELGSGSDEAPRMPCFCVGGLARV